MLSWTKSEVSFKWNNLSTTSSVLYGPFRKTFTSMYIILKRITNLMKKFTFKFLVQYWSSLKLIRNWKPGNRGGSIYILVPITRRHTRGQPPSFTTASTTSVVNGDTWKGTWLPFLYVNVLFFFLTNNVW